MCTGRPANSAVCWRARWRSERPSDTGCQQTADPLVAREGDSPLVPVVDDRLGIADRDAAGRRPGLVHVPRGQLAQLGNPALDVAPVGVELLALGDGVEDPVEGRR